MRLTNDTTELFKMFNDAIDMTKSKKKATLILNFENKGDNIEFFGILTNSGYTVNPNKKLFKTVPNLEAVDLDYVVKNMAIIPDSLSIEALDLSVRAYNCLKRAGIDTVGQIKQSIAPSQRIFPLRVSGKYRAASEHKTKRLPCVRSKIPCQRWGFRFFGSTFRKERKSILKMSVG